VAQSSILDLAVTAIDTSITYPFQLANHRIQKLMEQNKTTEEVGKY